MQTNINKRNNSLSEALSSFFNSAAILPVCISVLMAAVNKDLRMLLLFMLCQTGKKTAVSFPLHFNFSSRSFTRTFFPHLM